VSLYVVFFRDDASDEYDHKEDLRKWFMVYGAQTAVSLLFSFNQAKEVGVGYTTPNATVGQFIIDM